ncbi:MAG: hypothetical protein ABI120_03865 [Gemmatimonadaceae bacterium]
MLTSATQPPAPPPPPGATEQPVSFTTTAAPTAAEMLQAAKAYREVLQDQKERLRETRSSVASAMRDEQRTTADIAGLEKRLTVLDEQMVDLEKQIGQANVKESNAAAVPGAVVPDPPYQRPSGPDWDGVFAGGAIFSFALLFPFAIAYSRRIWRRSANSTVMLPPEVSARMHAMEEAIESVAIEVERIGEGQRFMTQALSENPRHLGAGAVEPVLVRAREAVHAERPHAERPHAERPHAERPI